MLRRWKDKKEEPTLQKTRSIRLTESAIMLAFATVLSLVKIVDLPYGGSITACSMLPVILIAYRYGTAWGLFTATAFSLLQLVTGMNSVMYGTSAGAVAVIILADYVVAFAVLGLGGVFRKAIPSQSGALAAGTLLVCVLRYICHVISGVTVWRDISIPAADSLLYSIGYNATYMIPETLITLVGAVYLSRVLDFRSDNITRAQPQAKRPDLAILYCGLWKAAVAAALIWDIKEIFPRLQVAASGEFFVLGFLDVNWVSVGVATGVGIVLAVIFFQLARRVPADSLFSALPFVGVTLAAAAGGYLIHGEVLNAAAEPENAVFSWLIVAVIAVAVLAFMALVLWRYYGRQKKG